MFPLFPPPPFIVSFEVVNRNQNVALELEYWAEKCTLIIMGPLNSGIKYFFLIILT
jgi:hypothetical protein